METGVLLFYEDLLDLVQPGIYYQINFRNNQKVMNFYKINHRIFCVLGSVKIDRSETLNYICLNILQILHGWHIRNLLTVKDLVEEMVQWYRSRCLDPMVWEDFVRPRVNPALVPNPQDLEGPPPATLQPPRLPHAAQQGFVGFLQTPVDPALPPAQTALPPVQPALPPDQEVPLLPAADSSNQQVRNALISNICKLLSFLRLQIHTEMLVHN